MHTTMTVKGQVTIPKSVRERAGLKPGTRVVVTSGEDGGVLVRPVDQHDLVELERRRADFARRLDAAQAIFDAQRDPNDPWQNMTTDEYMRELRDPLEPFELDGSLHR